MSNWCTANLCLEKFSLAHPPTFLSSAVQEWALLSSGQQHAVEPCSWPCTSQSLEAALHQQTSRLRTRMQKEPRQCLRVGSTPTRVMWVDQTSGIRCSLCSLALQWNATPERCGKPSLFVSLSVKKRRKASKPLRCTTSAARTSMEYRCDECLWNSPTRREKLARENGPDLEYVCLL